MINANCFKIYYINSWNIESLLLNRVEIDDNRQYNNKLLPYNNGLAKLNSCFVFKMLLIRTE